MNIDLERSAILSSDAKTNDLSLNHTEENERILQTFPTESTSLLLTSVASESSLERYSQTILQMYPKTNVSRFRAIFKLSKDWESDKDSAAESAYATVKHLVSESKLVFVDDGECRF